MSIKTTKCDPLAQLGERHLDRVEVTGSSPVRVIGCQTLETLNIIGFSTKYHFFGSGAFLFVFFLNNETKNNLA